MDDTQKSYTIEFDTEEAFGGEHLPPRVANWGETPLKDGQEVVVRTSTIEVLFDYPLTRPFTILSEMSGGGWTRDDLYKLVYEEYKEIYNKEDESVSNVIPSGTALNRDTTDGVYGIWGHDFGDLFLEGIEAEERDGVTHLELLIGS